MASRCRSSTPTCSASSASPSWSSNAILGLACVRAFNDFQIEWCSADPKRLIPLAFLPFWDVEASVVELRRCADLGFRGFNWGHDFEKVGLPALRDTHWDPLMNLAQDLETPVSFHIGFGNTTEGELHEWAAVQDDASFAQMSVLFFLGNAAVITDLCMGGICERFPRLNFVSVESGFGYVPYLLEAMDWMYKNNRGFEHAPWDAVAERVLHAPGVRHVLVREERGPSYRSPPGQCHVRIRLPPPDQLVARSGRVRPRTPRRPSPTTSRSFPTRSAGRSLHDTAARIYKLDD